MTGCETNPKPLLIFGQLNKVERNSTDPNLHPKQVRTNNQTLSEDMRALGSRGTEFFKITVDVWSDFHHRTPYKSKGLPIPGVLIMEVGRYSGQLLNTFPYVFTNKTQ